MYQLHKGDLFHSINVLLPVCECMNYYLGDQVTRNDQYQAHMTVTCSILEFTKHSVDDNHGY